MMEENNRKGPGVFYAVMGVATLVVAIIGATFAYFSASAAANGVEIKGNTNEDIAGALSISVAKVNTAVEGVNPNLVPANIDGTTGTITNAVKNNCVANGYTGCHLYKITASSKQQLADARIMLDSLTVTAKTKTNWAYAIYTGTDVLASKVVSTGGLDLTAPVDMHKDVITLAANTPVEYYLIVYLTNVDSAQNPDEYGTYTGSVSMNAAGGQVSATFSA